MQQRNYSLDGIRLAALLLLIACHACDPLNAAATYGAGASVSEEAFFWGRMWGSIARPCVPLFVMLTGALCLPVRQPMEQFWKRRITRVLWPFLIWAVLYNLFPWFTGLLGLDKSVVYQFFVWAGSDSQDLGVCLERVALIPITFDYLASHMWYIYMLIGLYLYLPIFSSWVERATAKQKRIVLALWLLSTFLPYVREFVAPYAFGECTWNSFGLFYYFAGFNGYLLLGHYLVHEVRIEALRRLSTVFLCGVAFGCGWAITYLGYTYITSLPEATPEQYELFWTYNSINVVLMSASLFAAILSLRPARPLHPALAALTLSGFGIYMIHYLFIGPTYSLFTSMGLHVALVIPAMAVTTLAISWAIVYPLRRWVKGSKIFLG